MKQFQLDFEEKEILTAFENDELASIVDDKDDMYVAIAKNTQLRNKIKITSEARTGVEPV